MEWNTYRKKANYVIALHEFNEELGKMQEGIEKIDKRAFKDSKIEYLKI